MLQPLLIENKDLIKDNKIKELLEIIKHYDKDINLYYIPRSVSTENGYSYSYYDRLLIVKDKNLYVLELDDLLDATKNLKNIGELISNIGNIKNLPDKLTGIVEDLYNEKQSGKTIFESICKNRIDTIMSPIENTLDYVLENISKPNRSDKNGFYETDRLDSIDELLTKSKYKIVYKTNDTVVYGKATPKKKDDCILVSSHADIVSSITKVYSEKYDNYYQGTYDNLATNAAITTIMLKDDNLPDNIYFAFNAEEETGRCTGATDSFMYLSKQTGNKPVCIALDVTDEGYSENRLFSVEGLTGDNKFKDKIGSCVDNIEGNNLLYAGVKSFAKDYTPFSKEHITCDTTVFDESVHYGKKLKTNALSICVPTDGNMHSNTGLNIKKPVYLGYIANLDLLLHNLTKTRANNILNIKPDDIKTLNDCLLEETKSITKQSAPAFKHQALNTSFLKYDWDIDDDYEDFYNELCESNLISFDDYSTLLEGMADNEGNELPLESYYNDFVNLVMMADVYNEDEFEYFYEDALRSVIEDENLDKDFYLIAFDYAQNLKQCYEEMGLEDLE